MGDVAIVGMTLLLAGAAWRIPKIWRGALPGMDGRCEPPPAWWTWTPVLWRGYPRSVVAFVIGLGALLIAGVVAFLVPGPKPLHGVLSLPLASSESGWSSASWLTAAVNSFVMGSPHLRHGTHPESGQQVGANLRMLGDCQPVPRIESTAGDTEYDTIGTG